MEKIFSTFFEKVLDSFVIISYNDNVINDYNQSAKGESIMFKKFIERIIKASNREEAIQTVFYGMDGIDIAFQRGKITWKEHEMLLALIEKMA